MKAYKKCWYVLWVDFEDPSWSKIEHIGKTKRSCVKWIKDNFPDYVDGGWDEDEDEVPDYIKKFDEDEVNLQLKLYIHRFPDE